MVRKKSTPVRNLRNNTLQILTERVESLERERIERENSSVICLEVPNTDDDGVVEERRRGWRRRHVCEVCDKDFACASNLTRHLCRHTGEKPFKCRVCDEEFTQQGDLTRHVSIHTGEWPHQCHVCLEAVARFGTSLTRTPQFSHLSVIAGIHLNTVTVYS